MLKWWRAARVSQANRTRFKWRGLVVCVRFGTQVEFFSIVQLQNTTTAVDIVHYALSITVGLGPKRGLYGTVLHAAWCYSGLVFRTIHIAARGSE